MLVSRAPSGFSPRPEAPGGWHPPIDVRPIPSTARVWGIRLITLTIAIWLASLELGFRAGLILLTLTGFAAAIAGLGKPALGVFGVVILCTLDAVSRIYLLSGGFLRWNTFNYWLVAVILLHLGWLVRLRDPRIRLLQAFLALLAIELAFSADPMSGAQHVLNLATVFGLLVYFARAMSDQAVWYWSAMVSGVVSGLGSAVFFLQQEALPDINPNAWSFFPLTSLFAACVYFAGPARQRRPDLLVLLAFMNAAWVFLSGSRGSLLIAVVCLLFILARLRPMKRVKLAVAAAALLVFGLATQVGELERHATRRFEALFDRERSMTSRTSGRWDLALGGWHIFLEEPLGVGTGGFSHAWATLRNREGISAFQGSTMEAHSAWIKVLAENGLPGILLFTSFVLSFAALGWRQRRSGAFLPGLLVTIAWSVAFLADEFQGKGLWYLGGAILLLTRITSHPDARVRRLRLARSNLGAQAAPAR